MADFSLKLEVHLAMPIRDIMNAFILGNDSFLCLYNAGHNSRKWVTSSFSVPQQLHSGDSFPLLNLCLLISSRYVPVNSRAFMLPFLTLETVDDRLVQIGWVDPIFNVVWSIKCNVDLPCISFNRNSVQYSCIAFFTVSFQVNFDGKCCLSCPIVGNS